MALLTDLQRGHKFKLSIHQLRKKGWAPIINVNTKLTLPLFVNCYQETCTRSTYRLVDSSTSHCPKWKCTAVIAIRGYWQCQFLALRLEPRHPSIHLYCW